MPDFESKFICQPYHGFASWDDFFTRQFRPGQRPITAVGDDSVIVNACESAPFKLAHGVKRIDNFWIKGQPYSLRHMFADDPVNSRIAVVSQWDRAVRWALILLRQFGAVGDEDWEQVSGKVALDAADDFSA